MSLDRSEEERVELSAGEIEQMSPSKTSLSSSMNFISSALKRLGISDSLNLMSNDPQHVVETCNAIYGLLLQHEKDVEYKETLKKGTLIAWTDVFHSWIAFLFDRYRCFPTCTWLKLFYRRSP